MTLEAIILIDTGPQDRSCQPAGGGDSHWQETPHTASLRHGVAERTPRVGRPMPNLMDAVRGLVCIEPLFNCHTIAEGIRSVDITEDQVAAADNWIARIKSGKLRDETPNHPYFMTEILVKILGYEDSGDAIKYQRAVGGGSNLKPDFTIMDSGGPLCFIELKGSETDLFTRQYRGGEQETPFSQLQNQIGKSAPRPQYGIVSNYNEFVLVTLEEGDGKCHRFRFEDIESDRDKLREFVWIFGCEIRGRGVDDRHKKSALYDREVTEKFYGLYSDTRRMLIREFGGGSDDRSVRARAISAAQTFLNRLVFMFFAEDLGLVDRMFRDHINRALSGNIYVGTSKVCSEILDLFNAFNSGAADLGIGPFNGGLFSDDFDHSFPDKRESSFFHGACLDVRHQAVAADADVLRWLERHPDLNPIICFLLALNSYNFRTDVNVNILGHIFEHSIAELSELRGNLIDRGRKDAGIYYTPEYVTTHICNHTIIPFLSKSGGATDPDALLDEYDDLSELESKLASVKILDPACGSGAFLTKAVDTMLGIYRRIQVAYRDRAIRRGGQYELHELDDHDIVRSIIRENIYGVDLSEESVGITRLAMFLKTARKNDPLPSVSGRIMAGNSLIRDKEATSGAFDWDIRFRDVFGRNNPGFDVIIGNPPYVRQERLDRDTKRHMGLPQPNDLGLRDFAIPRRSDLLAYFFYHSLNILRDGGVLGFITKDSWMHTDWGKKVQGVLLEKSSIRQLMRPDFRVFEDAGVRGAVITLRRTDSPSDSRITFATPTRGGFGQVSSEKVIRQHDLKPGNWTSHFLPPIPEPPINMIKMSAAGDLWRGMETGDNARFVLGRGTVEEFGITDVYLLPMVSRNTRGCRLTGDTEISEYILYVVDDAGTLSMTSDGRNVLKYLDYIKRLPAESGKGSKTSATLLEKRTIAERRQWYTPRLKRTGLIVMSRFIHDRMKVFKNECGIQALDRFAHFTPRDRAHTDPFLAFLSSSWFSLYQEKHGRSEGEGVLQFLMNHFVNAPVPDFAALDGDTLEKASAAWTRYSRNLDRGPLDEAVFAMLGMSPDQQEDTCRQLDACIRSRLAAAKTEFQLAQK